MKKEEFDSKLLQDIQERESALFEIERALFTRRYNLSVKHQDIFWVHSISMIYSVWEGFIQISFNLYIDELNKKNIDISTLSDSLIIHHMENSFKQFKEYPNKEKSKIQFFNKLNIFYEEKKQPISRIVNTQSNVGFQVLNKLLETFSLEQFNEHWSLYSHPNPNLKDSLTFFLRLRNSIAHGGDLSSEDKVSHSIYERFKNLIKDLMYEIRLRMLEGLNKETFLK